MLERVGSDATKWIGTECSLDEVRFQKEGRALEDPSKYFKMGLWV